MQARVTNTSKHLATAVEVFAAGADPSTGLPAATAHSVNLATLPQRSSRSKKVPESRPAVTEPGRQVFDCGRCEHGQGPGGALDTVVGLEVDHAERAFLIRSGNKDWGVLYGALCA